MKKIQKIEKLYSSQIEVAKQYYKIVFEMNGIHIRDKELELIAFSAVRGTISTPPIREEYIETCKVSNASMHNMSARLQKFKVFIKDKEGKVRVNPQIHPDFSQPEILIAIKLTNNGPDSI
jgi:hypothetical protein